MEKSPAVGGYSHLFVAKNILDIPETNLDLTAKAGLVSSF
jgi:hypothetical protein